MENEDKTLYSVSELSTSLKIPRTTLNDWLIKYSKFLTSELKGKRRVYTKESFVILKDISDARNNGIQLIDIEDFLEKKYGIHPELESDNITSSNVKEESENPTTELALASTNIEEMQLLVKNQFEELAKNVEAFNIQRKKSSRNSTILLTFLLILLLIVAAVSAFFGFQLIEKLRAENDKNSKFISKQNEQMMIGFSKSNEKINQVQNNNKKELEALIVSLNNENNTLKNEIKVQQEELKKLTVSLEKSNQLLELENIKNREAFAKQQKIILDKLIQKEQDIQKLQDVIVNNQAQTAKKIEELNNNIQDNQKDEIVTPKVEEKVVESDKTI